AVEPGHGTGNPLRPVPPRAALPRRDGRRPADRPLRPRRGPLPRAPRARDRRRPAPAEADRPPRHRRAARGDRPRLGPAGPRALGRRDDASVARARVRRKARRGHGGGDDAGRWPLELVRHVLSPGRDVRAARTPPSARRRRASPRRRPQPFRAPAVELLARLPRSRPTPPPRRPRRRRRLERLGDARGDRAEPRRAQRGAAVAPPPDAERGGRVADGAPRGGALVYCRVIACDFDGTGAANGRLAPETASVLASARALGFVTLLVTGRVLEDLQAAQVPFASFDAVVAENGALVWLPATNRTIQLAPPPPDAFLAELRARGIPYHAGAVVVGTWDRHGSDILHLIRRFGMASQLVYNRESLMVLPSGVDKAVGVQRALDELHRSPRSMVAFGDAENDRPLLELAEVGIAARGSVPAIATAADDRLALPGAAGVAHYVQRLLDRGGSLETPARRRIVVGEGEDGKPVALPTSGVNVTISGDPRSGKSWMAGLLVEALVEQGYVLCVFDPEGDYTVLGGRPRVLVLGADVPLPAPAALPNVLRDEPSSLVVNLAPLAHADKVRYVETAVACLDAARAVSGIPHWVVLDEAHYFLHARTALARRFEGRTGSYAFVTYRPSLLAPAVLADVNAHLVMRTTLEEERYFLTGLLQAHGPRDLVASDALARVQEGRPALLLDVAGA